jgi:hypothetical protein
VLAVLFCFEMNVEENVQEMAIARGIGADMRAGVWAGLYAVISMGLIITSAVFLYSTLDDRISLTTIEVFHDWRGLRQVFQDTSAYDPRVNLPALEYYTHFDGGSVSMDAMRDLHERGLLTDVQLGNFTSMFNLTTGLPLVGMADPHLLQQLASVFFSRFVGTAFPNSTKDLPREVVAGGINFVDPMILSRLYRVSGCSFPDALPGSTPATRSQGCACIAKTYVDFVLATAKMYTNVTRAARDEASDAVLRCMDRRVTWRTWGAGEVWTVHPLALALYSNGVFFLVCFAYLISFYHDSLFPVGWDGVMRTRVIQAMLVLVTGVLIFLLLLHNPFGNALQAVGLLLSLSTFLFSARRVLDYPNSNGGSRVPFVPEPHPLMVCFWLNLPLLIPGPLVGLALAGYTRDVYAVWIVAIVGSMMGILLSVQHPLLSAFFLCVLLYFLTVFVYRVRDSVFSGMCGMTTTSLFT